jgi:uncharacterized membrane protein SpoIIM required for sporulation
LSREIFEKSHELQWQALEASLDRLESRNRGNRGGEAAPDFPELYRQVCHHLALARHRRYGADLELRLNRLVLRGHQQLYRSRAGDFGAALRFVTSGFPRLVRSEVRLVLLSLLLFAGPLIAMSLAVPWRPELALSVLPPASVEQMGQQYAPEGSLEAGRPLDSDLQMFGFYIYNNIGIAFRTFASGILAGLGSIFFMIYNGLVIGAVMGHIEHMGYQENFYPFVIGHGAFELTAIVLAGAAGLRLGLALLAPGRLSRGEALLGASRRAIGLVYGVAGMLTIAAFLEAFWSPSAVPAMVKLVVGGVLWLYVLFYFTVAGRSHGS